MIEFTRCGYLDLLKWVKDTGFNCVSFSDVGDVSGVRKTLLLRHDVDCSMEYAFEMASLEAKEGISSTYFMMHRSPLYNLWSRRNTGLVKTIAALGHSIGLHYDAEFAEEQSLNHKDQIQFEIDALEKLVDAPVKAFSYHQPSNEIISRNVAVPNAVNAYSEPTLSDYEYISDSNRDWRGKDLIACLKTCNEIQLLIHPMWWMCEGVTTEACWDRAIELNFSKSEEQILATERSYGSKRQLKIYRT